MVRVSRSRPHTPIQFFWEYLLRCLTNCDHLSKGLCACTGKHCIFGHLRLVFIWSCFVFCLLFLLFYVICAPVPVEGTLSNYYAVPIHETSCDLICELSRFDHFIFLYIFIFL